MNAIFGDVNFFHKDKINCENAIEACENAIEACENINPNVKWPSLCRLETDKLVKDKISSHILKTTTCPVFKKKIVFFRKNRWRTNRQNIHTYFLRNDTYFYCYCVYNNFKHTDDLFFEYYSNDFEAFDSMFEKWIRHVNETYEKENSYCIIM